MQQIYFLSGPCGIGKSTAAEALAHRLLSYGRAVCLIHGDNLGDCLHLPEEFSPFTEDGHIRDAALWNRILQFNWQSLLDMAANALDVGADVVIDYVIEEELPLVSALAQKKGARLRYVVLTATREVILQRLTQRGDPETLGRSLFLKEKLERAEENRDHILDTTGLTIQQLLPLLADDRFLCE